MDVSYVRSQQCIQFCARFVSTPRNVQEQPYSPSTSSSTPPQPPWIPPSWHGPLQWGCILPQWLAWHYLILAMFRKKINLKFNRWIIHNQFVLTTTNIKYINWHLHSCAFRILSCNYYSLKSSRLKENLENHVSKCCRVNLDDPGGQCI